MDLGWGSPKKIALKVSGSLSAIKAKSMDFGRGPVGFTPLYLRLGAEPLGL